MTYEELEEEREAQSSRYHEQKRLERWEAEEAAKDAPNETPNYLRKQ